MNDPLRALEELTGRLRRECPWDREQTPETIATFVLEESYEVLSAIEGEEPDALSGELGDLLFQIFFLAELAREKGWFDLDEVARRITTKMVERHPHVFSGEKAADAAEVRASWEKRKRASRDADADPLAGIPAALPALAAANRMSARAADLGFDWERDTDLLDKIREEIDETRDAFARDSPARQEEEVGDLLFALANWARHRRIDPEQALRRANTKFRRRFARLAELSKRDGADVSERSAAELDRYWNAVKAEESKPAG